MTPLPVSKYDIEKWIREYLESRDRNQELVDHYCKKVYDTKDLYDECPQYVENVKLARENLQKEIDIYEKETEKYQKRLDNDINYLKILYDARNKFSNCRS